MTYAKPALVDLAFYPLALTQGLYVKYRAAQLEEAAGPRWGRTGEGPPLRILIVGDSSAAGVGVSTQDEALTGQLVRRLSRDHTVHWHLAARCGATALSVQALLDQVPRQRFDIAVTALGVNDAKNGVSLAAWRSRKAALFMRLAEEFGVRMVCASGMPPVRDFPLLPSPLRWALAERARIFDLEHRALLRDIPFVRYLEGPPRLDPAEMAIDGFHPGPAIYADWGRRTEALIRAEWPGLRDRRQTLATAAE